MYCRPSRSFLPIDYCLFFRDTKLSLSARRTFLTSNPWFGQERLHCFGPGSEGNELGCFSSTLIFLRARSACASRAIGALLSSYSSPSPKTNALLSSPDSMLPQPLQKHKAHMTHKLGFSVKKKSKSDKKINRIRNKTLRSSIVIYFIFPPSFI